MQKLQKKLNAYGSKTFFKKFVEIFLDLCLSLEWTRLDWTGPDRTGPDRTGPDRTGLEHLGPDRFQKTDPYHQIIIPSYHHIIPP